MSKHLVVHEIGVKKSTDLKKGRRKRHLRFVSR